MVDPAVNSLYSYLPGRPVELLDPNGVTKSATKETAWEAPHAGLVVYGGRVSTFVCRGMTFEGNRPSESTMSFRYVAGSGLEIAEQADSGSFEIFSSALRHLTITPRRAADTTQKSVVEVAIAGSAIIQSWFGENLTGRATCTDSLLAHVWNNSGDFNVAIEECVYQGLVGCSATSGTALVKGEPVVQVDDLDPIILDRTTLMNFVQDPSHTS